MIMPMLRLYFLLITIIITINLTNAQEQNDKQNPTTSNFQPSLYVVIGVLSFMFSLTFLLLMYAKMCYQQPNAIHIHNNQNISNNNNNNRAMFDTHTRFSGLDAQVVESLPFFRFSSLKGARHGLQCSVCLAEFEDFDILRLLPKCKHAFHIECIDQWLESHSTCPLCRQKVAAEDVVGRSSTRLFVDDSLSSVDVFVEREGDQGRSLSSRFSRVIGGSFRRVFNLGETHDQTTCSSSGGDFHRVNHQILVSDVVFRNRWSDVCSADLMFLNSEMLGIMSSDRISSTNVSGSSVINMEEGKIGELKRSVSNLGSKIDTGFEDSRRIETGHPKTRAMSEITAVSRSKDLMSLKNKVKQCLGNNQNEFYDDEIVKEDIKRRKKWFSIAKRTVQWFANRENNRFSQQSTQNTSQISNV